MTYNVHSCVGVDGRLDPSRIAAVINEANPDVVALQELDMGRPRSGSVDQALVIAQELGMHFHFHPALRVAEEKYGDAILSKRPLNVVQAGELPKVPRQIIDETRGALWVELQVAGHALQLMNTHLGLGRGERRTQAAALLGPEWLGAALPRGPVVLCGDFNSLPGWVVHSRFTAVLRDTQAATLRRRHAPTFPTRWPVICLDHIFVSAQVEVVRTEVVRTPLTRVASDHFPLLAELKLPPAA